VRHSLVLPMLLLCPAITAPAQVSVGVNLPGLSIGINQPVYPDLVPVPGYPVYYAPGSASNYFFYDGLYWVYQGDAWYSSTWYNGPWGMVSSYDVPLYVLRVPVSYYPHPPEYFGGWDRNAPPRWGDHWGPAWAGRRGGWDHWDHQAGPSRAPLPSYQRQFAGDRYPHAEAQSALNSQHYHYQPREAAVRQRFQQQNSQGAKGAPGQPGPGQPRPGQPSGPRPEPAPRSEPAPHPQGPAGRPENPARNQPPMPAGRPERPQQPGPSQPMGRPGHPEPPAAGHAPAAPGPRPGNPGPPAAQRPQPERAAPRASPGPGRGPEGQHPAGKERGPG